MGIDMEFERPYAAPRPQSLAEPGPSADRRRGRSGVTLIRMTDVRRRNRRVDAEAIRRDRQ